MQKIVLFIDSSEYAWRTPLKIGNLFINRFAVDEEAASEILKIFELEKGSRRMSSEESKQQGMDLIIKIDGQSFFWIKKSYEAKLI